MIRHRLRTTVSSHSCRGRAGGFHKIATQSSSTVRSLPQPQTLPSSSVRPFRGGNPTHDGISGFWQHQQQKPMASRMMHHLDKTHYHHQQQFRSFHSHTRRMLNQNDRRTSTTTTRQLQQQRYFSNASLATLNGHHRCSPKRQIIRAISNTTRRLSSNQNNKHNNRYQLYALPFSVSPNQALDKFMDWATHEQGLNYVMVSRDNVKLSAAYCPVWSFDVNLRFVVTEQNDNNTQKPRRRLDWKPPLFQVYGRQTVVHVPGLAAYAGYDYPRSLVNPIHNTSLVFLGDQAVPFGKWMLQDMVLTNDNDNESQTTIPITPDPWTATQKRAFGILKEELTGISQQEGMDVEVQTEVLRARRVYMPTYVVDYQILGVEFRAFLSGADAGAGVSGPSHKLWDSSVNQQASQGLQGFLGQAVEAVKQSAQTIGGQRTLGVLAVMARFIGQIAGRLAMRLPWIAAIVGGFIGFRKLVQPLIGRQLASAEWERQREHEANMSDDHYTYQDDFTDSGAAQRFFRANKTTILRHLAGTEHHERGDYDFFKDWEEWARRTYQQQQQQQDYYNYQQQQQQQRVYGQQQQQQQQRPKEKPKFQWDFDPNDPYSVLGIRRGATKQEVSAAFRREMLKYHPDTQGQASEAERIRSVERSKLISEAYRKIKSEMKG